MRFFVLPSDGEILFLILFACALQLLFAVRFALRTQRIPRPFQGRRASVLIIAAAVGENPKLPDFLEGAFGQDYEGGLRLRLVSPSRSNPAFSALAAAAARSKGSAKAMASELRPERCSGKITDLLFALEDVPQDIEILVFADSDLSVARDWLSNLIAPIERKEAVATTAAMLYVPQKTIASLMRTAWMAWGMPYFELAGNLTGQSLAIRRKDFDELDVRGLWARSLYEDLSLAALLRAKKIPVNFVHAAVPVGADDSTWGESLAVFNKWMTAYRIYDLRVWILGAFLILFKTYALYRGVVLPLVLGDMAAVGLVLAALRPNRLSWLQVFAGTVFSPLLLPVFWINYAASLRSRVKWGPYTYRIRGPQSIEVEP